MSKRKAKRWDVAMRVSATLMRNRLETLCEEFDAAVQLEHSEALQAICIDLFKLAGAGLHLVMPPKEPIEVLADVLASKLAAKLAPPN